MLARNLSLASAMTLVGLGLFANAGVNLATSGQGVAHADDLKQSAKTHTVVDVPDVRGSKEVRSGTMAMGAVPDCQLVDSTSVWFGAIRELCENPDVWGGDALGNVFSIDANGDGIEERLLIDNSGVLFQTAGESFDPCLMRQQVISFDGESLVFEHVCVLDTQMLASWFLARQGMPDPNARVTNMKWVDMDGDSDLDLVLRLHFTMDSYALWLENTGFQKPNFLAGDINQDGSVDGVDIAQLLSDWTGG